MTCDDVQRLIERALDGRPPYEDERRELVRHCLGCPQCSQTLGEVLVMDMLLYAFANRVRPGMNDHRRKRRWRWAWGLATVAVVLAVAGAASWATWSLLRQREILPLEPVKVALRAEATVARQGDIMALSYTLDPLRGALAQDKTGSSFTASVEPIVGPGVHYLVCGYDRGADGESDIGYRLRVTLPRQSGLPPEEFQDRLLYARKNNVIYRINVSKKGDVTVTQARLYELHATLRSEASARLFMVLLNEGKNVLGPRNRGAAFAQDNVVAGQYHLQVWYRTVEAIEPLIPYRIEVAWAPQPVFQFHISSVEGDALAPGAVPADVRNAFSDHEIALPMSALVTPEPVTGYWRIEAGETVYVLKEGPYAQGLDVCRRSGAVVYRDLRGDLNTAEMPSPQSVVLGGEDGQ